MDWLDEVLRKLFAGEVAVLPRNTELDPAPFIRYLTGQDVYRATGPHNQILRCVLVNASFTAPFDVRDLRHVSGVPLPPLEFRACEFRKGFLASGASLYRLAFEGCVFTAADRDKNQISLRNAKITTECRIQGLRPARPVSSPLPSGEEAGHLETSPSEDRTTPDSQWAYVDGFALSVGTNFIVQDSHLRAPDPDFCKTQAEPSYALDLSNAAIACDLRLQSRVMLEGGLKMRNASVGGHVWAQGLYATKGHLSAEAPTHAEERFAFRMDNSTIGGGLSLNVDTADLLPTDKLEQRRFRCVGGFNLQGLRLKGSLWLTGAKLDPEDQRPDRQARLDGAVIEGDLLAPVYQDEKRLVANFAAGEQDQQLQLEISGDLILSGCRVSGTSEISSESRALWADGARFDSFNVAGKSYLLHAVGISVRRDVTVSLKNILRLDLSSSVIDGGLDISRSTYLPQEQMSKVQRKLWLEDTSIGHSLVVSPAIYAGTVAQHWPSLSFYPKKNISLWQMSIVDQGSQSERSSTTFNLLDLGEEPPIVLNGESRKIHDLNQYDAAKGSTLPPTSPLSLRSLEAARDYLAFFCASVWGDKGAFALVETADQLPGSHRKQLETLLHHIQHDPDKQDHADKQGSTFFFTRLVRYSTQLFKAEFKVEAHGMVTMLEDEPIALSLEEPGTSPVSQDPLQTAPADVKSAQASYSPDEIPVYTAPLRMGTAGDSDFPDCLARQKKQKPSGQIFDRRFPFWKQLLFIDLAGVLISLRNTQCGTLDDDAGRVWTKSRTDLENFIYKNSHMPEGISEDEEVRNRLQWLGDDWRQPAQAPTGVKALRQNIARAITTLECNLRLLFAIGNSSSCSSPKKFRAQPYTQLARVMRERGDDDSARKIEAERIRLAAQDRATDFWGRAALLWWWFYGFCFNYGLSPLRAFRTLVAFLILGFLIITTLDDSGLLRANVAIVAPAALQQPQGEVLANVPVSPTQLHPINCKQTINPALYAAELMTPVLNFGEAKRCDIGSVEDSSSSHDVLTLWGLHHHVPHSLCTAWFWEHARALYILIGSIITSLALLTFSGIARRWEH